MAVLSTIKNLIQCGADAVIGTGQRGCKPFLKKCAAIWLTPAGFVFDGARELNEEYIQELQAQGKLIVLKGVRTFTDNSSEDQYETLEDQTKTLTALGLYEFMVNFINGFYFHSALHSISGYGNYDVTFVDRDSNILATNDNGDMKGFTAGYVQASKLTWPTDTTAQREGIGFQLLERSELDTDFLFIQGSQLESNLSRVDGVNEIGVSFASVPADAGTSISVKAVTKQDGKPFEAVSAENWLVTVNGATQVVTGDDSATAGTYVLTVPALATNDVVTVRLYDSAENRSGVILDGEVYQSKTASATVV